MLQLARSFGILKSQANANETRKQDMLDLLRKAYRSSTEQLLLFDDIENTAMLGTVEETASDA